jgi:hypothetical protein
MIAARSSCSRAAVASVALLLWVTACDREQRDPPARHKVQSTSWSPDGGCELAPTLPDASVTDLPAVSPPEVLGVLVGPGAAHPIDLNIYGTDLGFSFEHKGQLFVVFGDSLETPDDICNEKPNDDALATIPNTYDGGIPELTFATKHGAADKFKPLLLIRGTLPLRLGFGQAPMAAFSDGENVFATFGRLELTRCGETMMPPASQCATDDKFVCSKHLGECVPAYNGVVPALCDIDKKEGCFSGQNCKPISAPVCIDTTSSQYDGTRDGEIAAVVEYTDIGMQRPNEPGVFDEVLAWPTSKFLNMTARTVERFDFKGEDVDYAPGHGALLVWGRPRFAAEGGREAQLYLMAHELPMQVDDKGALVFEPHYFTGVDAKTGEPQWSALQSAAKPLAMDGIVNGDPHEALHIVNQSTVSWLGAPINKWVMMYGGSLSNFLLFDPVKANDVCASGSIVMRFADHPWGPWSPPVPHLIAGSPKQDGDLYGPGGYLYSAQCEDSEAATCVRADATISKDNNQFPACTAGLILWDNGRLYGPNIIDAYTTPNDDGGMDMLWNVSTWNPYSVLLVKSKLMPLAH